MGLASFNRMRLRRNEAMLPENIAKAEEKEIVKTEEIVKEEPVVEEVIKEEVVKEVKEEPAKRGSKRK